MKKAFRFYLLLQTVQLILAFVCGPHSCEWGNTVYFCFGVAALVLSFLFPLLQKDWKQKKRILFAFLFLPGSVVMWCAWFVLGEFRIMCRMF
jgi:hypothetical protein